MSWVSEALRSSPLVSTSADKRTHSIVVAVRELRLALACLPRARLSWRTVAGGALPVTGALPHAAALCRSGRVRAELAVSLGPSLADVGRAHGARLADARAVLADGGARALGALDVCVRTVFTAPTQVSALLRIGFRQRI